MKKLFKVALVAGFMMLTAGFAKAQSKIGYLDFNQVIDAMPETKTVSTQLQAYSKTFMDQMQNMQNELQTKGAAYEKSQATMTDAARTAAQTELNDINKRLQDFNQTATQKVEQKRNELGKPLFDKAKLAVNAVAKEKGYTYVIDSGSTNLLVSPAGDDLLAAVKLKLGIK
ncbi:OmpH family outer membrane protein [Mucilaginibacter sp. CSA2-8R]|uniref:OmpH family outer membrane protein n=1 Tax=Mucilaginibacter sp. CSA2-8R TaxID=3141542 RepID=UPI00315CDB10